MRRTGRRSGPISRQDPRVLRRHGQLLPQSRGLSSSRSFLERAKDPDTAGRSSTGGRSRDTGWQPMSDANLVREMATAINEKRRRARRRGLELLRLRERLYERLHEHVLAHSRIGCMEPTSTTPAGGSTLTRPSLARRIRLGSSRHAAHAGGDRWPARAEERLTRSRLPGSGASARSSAISRTARSSSGSGSGRRRRSVACHPAVRPGGVADALSLTLGAGRRDAFAATASGIFCPQGGAARHAASSP